MNSSLDARAAILGRIREALQDGAGRESPETVSVPRTYRQRGTAEREELVERFIERVADYKVNLRRIAEQERNPQEGQVERIGMAAQLVLAEELTVIRGDDHHGAIEASLPLQRQEEAVELGVEVGDRRVVAIPLPVT